MTQTGVYTVAGVIATRRGHALQDQLDGTAMSIDLPAADFRTQQPAFIPLLLAHDPEAEIGHVAYLERENGRLWAVAVLEQPDVLKRSTRWQFSPGIIGKVVDRFRTTNI